MMDRYRQTAVQLYYVDYECPAYCPCSWWLFELFLLHCTDQCDYVNSLLRMQGNLSICKPCKQRRNLCLHRQCAEALFSRYVKTKGPFYCSHCQLIAHDCLLQDKERVIVVAKKIVAIDL